MCFISQLSPSCLRAVVVEALENPSAYQTSLRQHERLLKKFVSLPLSLVSVQVSSRCFALANPARCSRQNEQAQECLV